MGIGSSRKKHYTVFSDSWQHAVEDETKELIIPPHDPSQPDDTRTVRIIGDQGAKVFAHYFANNGKIKELTIEGPLIAKGELTMMSAAGFKSLEECLLRDFTLTTLKFQGHNITKEIGVELASYLKDNQDFRHLSFWNNKLTDETAVEMVKLLQQNPNLETINLGENPLTEAAKSQIEKLIVGTKLKVQMF
mmetsp:Transcript_18982/g.26548  ORF Transcript_18982/g.26548 Transcript_18982/m.26548 type:complete len:191 (-) Transcript_18982:30-602(-)